MRQFLRFAPVPRGPTRGGTHDGHAPRSTVTTASISESSVVRDGRTSSPSKLGRDSRQILASRISMRISDSKLCVRPTCPIKTPHQFFCNYPLGILAIPRQGPRNTHKVCRERDCRRRRRTMSPRDAASHDALAHDVRMSATSNIMRHARCRRHVRSGCQQHEQHTITNSTHTKQKATRHTV